MVKSVGGFFPPQDALRKCTEENQMHEISSVEEVKEKMLQRVEYVFT